MISQVQTTTGSMDLALARNKVLRNTYLLLGITMIPTVIGAVVGMNTSFAFLAGMPILGPLLMFAVMMGLLFAVSATRNTVWSLPLLLAFTFVAGFFLGPILQVAMGLKNGGQLVGMAAGGTGVIFTALAGYATVTRKDFSFMGKFLFIGLILLIVASLANIFFQVPALSLTISAVAVLLFSLYILYDVSDIVNGGETNYVMATLRIYMDIYNLFIHLLNLLMAFAGQRD